MANNYSTPGPNDALKDPLAAGLEASGKIMMPVALPKDWNRPFSKEEIEDLRRRIPRPWYDPDYDAIGHMNMGDKIAAAIMAMDEHLAPEVWRQLLGMFAPPGLVIMTGIFAIYVNLHVFLVGWVADGFLVLTTYFFLGYAAAGFLDDLFQFIKIAAFARNKSDLSRAAARLAHAIATAILAVGQNRVMAYFKRLTTKPRPVGSQGPEKVLWGTWNDYPKQVVDGKEYAVVGNRLYSRHAVNRMQPSGLRFGSGGSVDGGKTGQYPQIVQAGPEPNPVFKPEEPYTYGRSISPNYVEDVIRTAQPTVQTNGNLAYRSGTVEVKLSPQGRVVTVETF